MIIRSALILMVCFLCPAHSTASFFDHVLSYDDAVSAKGMHLKISGFDKLGREWITREVSTTDFDFLKSLYGDKDIMALVGDGSTRDDAFIRHNIEMWQNNYALGSPLAAWILEYTDDKTPVGIFIADTLHAPGVLEVGRIIHTKHQRIGLGTSLMHAVVKIWGPMIQALGAFPRNERQGEVFRCFKGKPLEKLYITCSPTNLGSWKSQVHAGFQPLVAEQELALQESIRDSFSFQVWEECLTEIFESTLEKEKLLSGKLYHVIDPEGAKRTVSLHPKYNRIKYHFECLIKSN